MKPFAYENIQAETLNNIAKHEEIDYIENPLQKTLMDEPTAC